MRIYSTTFFAAALILIVVLICCSFALAQEQTDGDSIFDAQTYELPQLRYFNNIGWSPDGQTLAISGDKDIWLYDYDGNTLDLVRHFTGHSNLVTALAWSPDGNLLASAGWDETVRVWDIATGNTITVFEMHKNRVSAIAWQPEGEMLVSGGWDEMVYVWNPRTGEIKTDFTVHLDQYATNTNSVAWRFDGEAIAAGGFGSPIWVWNIETGNIIVEFRPNYVGGGSTGLDSFTWSPDGILMAIQKGHTQIVDPFTGETIANLGDQTRQDVSLAWNPNGEWLATNSRDGITRIWNAQTWQEVAALTNGLAIKAHLADIADYAYTIAWSPDGSKLASVGGDSLLRIWDLTVIVDS